MPDARIAFANDLVSLLALFDASNVSRYHEPEERAEHISSEEIWRVMAYSSLYLMLTIELSPPAC